MGALRLWLCFLPLILCAQSLSTSSVRHLEPIEGFEILHLGTQLQSLQPNLDLNERGHVQPYPDDLHVKFQAFGREHRYDLSVDRHLLADDAKIQISDGNSVISEEPATLTTYRGKSEKGAITVTITPEHLMHAVIVTDTEVLQIDPISVHRNELQGSQYSLLENAQHKMVIFRHSDADTKSLLCGALESHVAPTADAPIHVEAVPNARRLLDLIPFNSTCFPNYALGKNMTMSFGIDYGFQRNMTLNGQPSCTAATTFTQQTVALINTVYFAQFKIWISWKSSFCQASTSTATWAYDRTVKKNCPDINSALGNFSTWRQSVSTDPGYQAGAWMMATDCYPPAGTVGLAWIGGLCRKYYGAGVSSYTGSLWWLVVAHELGHNFGAQHSFQNGVGTTGGIMDYGDSTYNGTIQMHPVYTQADICAQITKSSSASTCGSDCIPQNMCWNSYAPVCGNGIIEPPEGCDDGANNGGASSCCTSTCVAKAGIECTSGECCLNCMFATTNTSCASQTGYCSRGVCKSTTCTTYSFGYCGTDVNPCKYTCKNPYATPAYACSNMAGWTDSATRQPFNMNATDGSICSRSPYSTCVAGVCVASAVSYSWQTSTWSSCSVTCGSGTQTASVWCASSSGTQVADTNCVAASKPVSPRACTMPACLVYSWKLDESAWSSCNKDCGTGWQTRPVPMCYEQSAPTVSVSASLCGTVPATNRTCNTAACPVAWVVTGWNACTVSCGTGTQSPKVACQQTQNGVQSVVADSLCTAAKPGNQSCNTQACATYSWNYGTWSTCSVSCGGGTQTRSADCRDNTNAVVASTNCAGSAVISQSCGTSTCPNYQWNVGAWGSCTVTCGGGVQNRNVTCVDMNASNATAADYLCTTTKPSLTAACNSAPCPTYTWVTSSWTACPVSCGNSTVTRTAVCRDTANNVDAPGMCGAQPATQQACAAGACPVYVWWLSAWTTCTANCGGGTQTRTPYCIIQGPSTVVGNGNCTSPQSSPTQQACNTDPCQSYNWVTDAWTTCSKVCGGGTQTRTYKCVNNVTNVVGSNSQCTAAAPVTQQACNTDLCPGYWYTGSWGVCSLSCGSGTYTRIVECRDSGNQTTVSSSRCTGAPPSSTGPCNTFACPAWNATAYGPCSAACGDGLMTRNVTCYDPVANAVVASTQCTGSAPSTQAPCNVMPCPNWVPGNWSACSTSCGGGTQTRSLACKFPTDYANPNGIIPPTSLCPVPAPATTQACGTDTCPTYYYSVAWGTCSTTCGDGTQTGTVTCMNSITQAAVSATNCAGSAPASTRTCNVKACVVPAWVPTSSWTTCNGVCTGGTQTRSVACVDSTTNQPVSNSLCSGSLATSQSCSAAYTCKQGSQCRNNTDGNFCKCTLGYSGDDCSIVPQISSTNLDIAQFPLGVPLGETVLLTWTTTGYMPFVAVLLDSLRWKYPKYISAQAINDIQINATQRSFSWKVDSGLPVGNDYSMIVYYSPTVFDTYPKNGYFSIADPCAYISCNGYGTCNSTTSRCNCLPGYQGDNCETPPCAKCNQATSTCLNSGATMGFCTCNTNWTGDTCDVPSGCSFSCQNGGVVKRTTASFNFLPSCTSLACTCTNFYNGSTCQYCGLTCKHGQADSSCLTCQCGANSGWMGRDCGCQYYILSVHVKNDNVDDSDGYAWVNDPDQVASFEDGFSKDIAATLSIQPKRVIPILVRPDATDGPLKGAVEVLFLLTQDCVDFSFMSSNIFAKETGRPVVHIDLQALDSARAEGKFKLLDTSSDQPLGDGPSLDELVAKLQSDLDDKNSAVSRGYVSSGILASQGVVLIPPTSEPQPQKKSKWIDNNYWVIIVVIGGVFALGLGLFCLRRWKNNRPVDYNHESVPATSSTTPGESTTNTRAIYMEELGKKDKPAAGSDTDLTSPELPAGWTKMFEERTGQYYYYNTKSGVSQWEVPTTPA